MAFYECAQKLQSQMMCSVAQVLPCNCLFCDCVEVFHETQKLMCQNVMVYHI